MCIDYDITNMCKEFLVFNSFLLLLLLLTACLSSQLTENKGKSKVRSFLDRGKWQIASQLAHTASMRLHVYKCLKEVTKILHLTIWDNILCHSF